MPNELHYQRRMIEAIEGLGGKGFKTSCRFLVGMPDLVFQVPYTPTCFLEAKYSPAPRKKLTVSLKVTGPQTRFLKSMHEAGAVTGVVSFISKDAGLGIAIRTIAEIERVGFNLVISDHRWARPGDHLRAMQAEYLAFVATYPKQRIPHVPQVSRPAS